MFATFTALLAASATLVSGAALAPRGSGTASMTPHDVYGSSIGVPGCKVNVNRIAYWPSAPSCDDICVKVSNAGRHVYLLKVDQSGGAYDISYDAWNYLKCGKSATVSPETGGGEEFAYEYVHPSKCAHLMHEGKLPLNAVPSMNYLMECLGQPNSWVAKNHNMYNIWDQVCKYGVDEKCHLDLATTNQPICPTSFGTSISHLLKENVYNLAYGTGKKTLALQ